MRAATQRTRVCLHICKSHQRRGRERGWRGHFFQNSQGLAIVRVQAERELSQLDITVRAQYPFLWDPTALRMPVGRYQAAGAPEAQPPSYRHNGETIHMSYFLPRSQVWLEPPSPPIHDHYTWAVRRGPMMASWQQRDQLMQ
jgi:hypothetical protein